MWVIGNTLSLWAPHDMTYFTLLIILNFTLIMERCDRQDHIDNPLII